MNLNASAWTVGNVLSSLGTGSTVPIVLWEPDKSKIGRKASEACGREDSPGKKSGESCLAARIVSLDRDKLTLGHRGIHVLHDRLPLTV